MKKPMNLLIMTLFFSIIFIISCGKRELRETKYDNGQIKEKYYVKLDRDGNYLRDGRYLRWYKNGHKEVEGFYKNGKISDTNDIPFSGQDGKWFFWYDNGQKRKEMNFHHDNREGLAVGWYDNGQMNIKCFYKSDKLDGKYVEWHENGYLKKEGYFKNGIPDGHCVTWYDNRQKQEESNYKNGKLEGAKINWYINGNKESEGFFCNDSLEGKITAWYENGNKKCEFIQQHGLRQGKYFIWYESGHKKAEADYLNNTIVGKVKEWDSSGNELNSTHGTFAQKDETTPTDSIAASKSITILVKYQKPFINIRDLIGCWKAKNTCNMPRDIKTDSICFGIDNTFKAQITVHHFFDFAGNPMNDKYMQFMSGNIAFDGNVIKTINISWADNRDISSPKEQFKGDSFLAIYYQNQWKLIPTGFLKTNIDSLKFSGKNILEYLQMELSVDCSISNYLISK
jgi:antitoxin component YwqK of YwqJK toxin-antitoxin module